MQKPAPVLGLVIRYDYLWKDEARAGRTEGAKIRPCIVVIASEPPQVPLRALVAAITHTPPGKSPAVEIPPRVKHHLGLDDDRSWIILDELNDIDWTDPGIVPATQLSWEYGYMPQKLAQQVLDALRAFDTVKPVPIVRR